MELIVDAQEKMHCLICDNSVGVSARNFVSIFSNQVLFWSKVCGSICYNNYAFQVQTISETPLHVTVSKLVDKELTEDNVHSLVTCKKCFKLFAEYDELEQR